MDQTETIDYVSRIIYKPGWRFEARPFYQNVMVDIFQSVVDTSYPPEYTTMLPYPFEFRVEIPDGQTEEQCGRMVLEACINHEREMLVHEAREFFRVKTGTGANVEYIATFHPHHYFYQGAFHEDGPGRKNWTSTNNLTLPANESLPDL